MSSATISTLLELPVDILVLVFAELDAHSFLCLTATCHALHSPIFVHDANFWSSLVRRDFRVPNQAVVQNDGLRWQKLYRRLRTQSRVYTWGNNENVACLGHAGSDQVPSLHPRRLQTHRRRTKSTWPGEMQAIQELGIISDIQCGGWSTTVLTSSGELHTVGVLDGGTFIGRDGRPFAQSIQHRPSRLRFPAAFQRSEFDHRPDTAIKQFSAGRSHVLGLSDSGKIWSWQDGGKPGIAVRFLHHETKENVSHNQRGAVRKVVAGWGQSAALLTGIGIVIWDILRHHAQEPGTDLALILESVIVSGTDFVSSTKDKSAAKVFRNAGEILPESPGEVENFILLGNFIVFNTSFGKVFAAKFEWNRDQKHVSVPVELPLSSLASAGPIFASDVQGSHLNFAVLASDGTVLTSDQDRISAFCSNLPSNKPLFSRIPALQNQGVISVAFGDYHFHALHAAGYITSYGHEPQACGALGLGGRGDPEGRLRGIRYPHIGGDGRLLPHAYTQGRRVWFEAVKRDWITFLTSGGVNPEEAADRVRMAIGNPEILPQGEVSEWVEQEGRDWIEKFGLQGEDEDGLGAYFALSVAAAGWHSGALVLVNEELLEKLNTACEMPIEMPCVSDAPDFGSDAGTGSLRNGTSGTDFNRPPTSDLRGLWDAFVDIGRQILGYQPPGAAGTHAELRVPNGPAREGSLQSFGASPREGVIYRWAGDHFPRLELSDGRVMPGAVELDSWRYGRPEWQSWDVS